MQVAKKDICATVAYLIGTRWNILMNCYGEEKDLLNELHKNKEATVIRYLCKLRTALMLKFKKTDNEICFNLKNINKLEWFDQDNIKQLEQWGIEIVKANYRAQSYVYDISKLINDNIEKCSGLFPSWINWSYIKSLFEIPHISKENTFKNEFTKYMEYISWYPFQQYIYWEPRDCGSLLFTDIRFLNYLYAMHDDHFAYDSRLTDAHEETKNSIYDFIRKSEKIIVAVDCENSDVYKLYGTIKNLNQNELSKIEKIVLYDDAHTTCGWDWLHKFTNISVEHIEVERVTGQKSLVDIKMTAGVCQNYYQHGVTSFIIVSSDSDYWGLISSLPDAKFLVMYEYMKCGQAIKDALEQRQIYYCSIDDFCSGNIEDLKKVVLLDILKKYLPNLLSLNAKDLAKRVFKEAWIDASDEEINNFYNKYIKTLKLSFNDDGEVSLNISVK